MYGAAICVHHNAVAVQTIFMYHVLFPICTKFKGQVSCPFGLLVYVRAGPAAKNVPFAI